MDEFIDVKDLVEDILTELRVSDSAKKDDSEDCFSEKEAKDYLREKFSDDVIRTFFEREKQATDAVFVWKRNTKICENCNGSTCGLLKYYRRDETIPFIQLGKDYQGKEQLGIVYSFDRGCRYNPLEGDFGRLFYKSGLVKWQIRQDFDNFEAEEEGLIKAKKLALKACTNQSNLILAGQSGVGKTHLAVAIALKTMRQKHQVKFCLVSEMLDEIRHFAPDYYDLMSEFKEVSCLVLDDLGKEKSTNAGLDYLYQIIDYRYRHQLQTIVTTNANTPKELIAKLGSELVEPMMGRLVENGAWITVKSEKNFRLKLTQKNIIL